MSCAATLVKLVAKTKEERAVIDVFFVVVRVILVDVGRGENVVNVDGDKEWCARGNAEGQAYIPAAVLLSPAIS